MQHVAAIAAQSVGDWGEKWRVFGLSHGCRQKLEGVPEQIAAL